MNHHDPSRKLLVFQFGYSEGYMWEKSQMMLNKKACQWRTLCTRIKHLNFIPKKLRNWNIWKKKSDNQTDLKKNYFGNTPVASHLPLPIYKVVLMLKVYILITGHLWNGLSLSIHLSALATLAFLLYPPTWSFSGPLHLLFYLKPFPQQLYSLFPSSFWISLF